jgi:hypothetical protein
MNDFVPFGLTRQPKLGSDASHKVVVPRTGGFAALIAISVRAFGTVLAPKIGVLQGCSVSSYVTLLRRISNDDNAFHSVVCLRKARVSGAISGVEALQRPREWSNLGLLHGFLPPV